MKSILLGLLLVGATQSAIAGEATVKTTFTCQQNDGDFWYEVGVATVGNGRSVLLLIQHDGDRGTKTLIYQSFVKEKQSAGKVVFQSANKEATLTVGLDRLSRGNFLLEIPGPHEALPIQQMECYANSDVTYDTDGTEPRMSVGN